MSGEYIMNTDKLKKFLGREYDDVVHYSIAEAFADSFKLTSGSSQGSSDR